MKACRVIRKGKIEIVEIQVSELKDDDVPR